MTPPGKGKRDGLFNKMVECLIYCSIVVLSYYAAWYINITGGYELRNLDALNSSSALIAVGSALIFAGSGIFKTLRKSFVENSVMMLMAAFYIAVLAMALAFYARSFALPRSLVLVAFVLQVPALSLTKCVFISFLRKHHGERSIMIIAPQDEKEHLIGKLLSDYRFTDKLHCFLEPGDMRYREYIDEIDHIMVSDAMEPEALDDLVRATMERRKRLYLIPRVYEIAVLSADIGQYSDILFLKMDNLQLSWENSMVKRGMDLLIAIPTLVCLLPLMGLIALVILVTEGRPVVFAQERVTINNRVFRLYKFRSMKRDAEKESGAVLASEEDPRITAIGRFLRRFWLDELPQLFNVISGDMSLVGPRPERPVFIDRFSEQLPDFRYRLSVKAGVTGLAQVMGKYATSPENKIKFDLMYIRNAGILFDLRIIADTVKKVILGTLRRGENKDLSYHDALAARGLKEICVDGAVEFYSENISEVAM